MRIEVWFWMGTKLEKRTASDYQSAVLLVRRSTAPSRAMIRYRDRDLIDMGDGLAFEDTDGKVYVCLRQKGSMWC